MQKINSTVAGASRNIGVKAVTAAVAPRPSSVVPLIRSIYLSARRWMAGRGVDIQVISVQRGDFSIIT